MRLLLSKCQEEFETRSKATSGKLVYTSKYKLFSSTFSFTNNNKLYLFFLAFDKKDSELSQEELHFKQIAKRKMLGNIKFMG